MLRVSITKRLTAARRRGDAFVLEVAFDAPRDCVTILFGPSGSGKTTLLRLVAGILKPDLGSIRLSERALFDSDERINLSIQQRRVGFVFQDYALFPHLTAEQNVAFGIPRADGRARRERARELLSLFRLEHAAERRPAGLSGGEQQRVALARALGSEPAVMLLDEPLAAVDEATRRELLAEVASAQERARIPFLYVTHNPAEAVRLGARLVVLHEGHVAQQGTPLEIFSRPRSAPVARVVGAENLFAGLVVEHREREGTTLVNLGGSFIETGLLPLAPGACVTLGLRSEDVLVARESVSGTSARNILS
ncbi:MAG: molybdenum ABC transporter ATP-binding protein, partial [Pyrinomonadaceae bacterium]